MTYKEFDRVRCSTSSELNNRIDSAILQNLKKYEGKTKNEIAERILILEKEWSIERILELNASTIAFIGVLLAAFINIFWLILPGLVLVFLAFHAIQGWCPPIPILRRLKIRTRKEIDWEKFSLKIKRGDFNTVSENSPVDEIFKKVKIN